MPKSSKMNLQCQGKQSQDEFVENVQAQIKCQKKAHNIFTSKSWATFRKKNRLDYDVKVTEVANGFLTAMLNCELDKDKKYRIAAVESKAIQTAQPLQQWLLKNKDCGESAAKAVQGAIDFLFMNSITAWDLKYKDFMISTDESGNNKLWIVGWGQLGVTCDSKVGSYSQFSEYNKSILAFAVMCILTLVATCHFRSRKWNGKDEFIRLLEP